MTRLLFLVSAFIFTGTALCAQNTKETNGIIRGTIVTSDGKPAASVTVEIGHAKRIGISNEKGEYMFKNIKPGNWIIQVSAAAATSQQSAITLVAGQTLTVDFTLKESAQQLQEVIVTTKNLNKENSSVAKMPLKRMENPQVYKIGRAHV